MITITIPESLAGPLVAEAERRGTTPELLALEAVRRVIPEPAAAPQPPTTTEPPPRTLYDQLKKHIGVVAGSGEPFSQDCGKKFADGLAEGRPARP